MFNQQQSTTTALKQDPVNTEKIKLTNRHRFFRGDWFTTKIQCDKVRYEVIGAGLFMIVDVNGKSLWHVDASKTTQQTFTIWKPFLIGFKEEKVKFSDLQF